MVYPVFRQTLCLLFLSHSRAATQVARSIPPRRITGAWRWRHPLWKPSRRLKIARNPRWHRSLDGSKKQKKNVVHFLGNQGLARCFELEKKVQNCQSIQCKYFHYHPNHNQVRNSKTLGYWSRPRHPRPQLRGLDGYQASILQLVPYYQLWPNSICAKLHGINGVWSPHHHEMDSEKIGVQQCIVVTK